MSTKASRHKSCLKCIQTKRKCDRTQPRCRRCIASNSVCQYIGRNRGQQQQQQQQPSTQPSGADQSFVPISMELQHEAQQLPANWELQPYHTTALMTSLPTPYTDGTIFEFPNHPFNLGEMPYDDDALQFSCNDSNTNTSSAAVQVSSSTNLCTARPVTQFTPPEAVIRPRVEFVAKRLASIPRRFASEAQTMFIHRIHFQYTCPPALQDAMSACALYSMKTVANRAVVLGHVQRKCEQLVASTDAVVAERNELLAALQALLLYQMIRLFDGDIRLRVLAETDEAVALQWAQRLKASLRDDDAVVFQSVYSRDQVACHTSRNAGLHDSSSDTWHAWLATESIRRTIITTYILSGIYNFLKLGYDGPTPDLRLAFTAQTALWGAQSETGWRWARDDGSIENLEMRVEMWDEVMGKAGPRDLEEMGVVVMVMLWGVEGARRWLGREVGGRFGLGEGE